MSWIDDGIQVMCAEHGEPYCTHCWVDPLPVARCQRCGGAGVIDMSIIDNEYAAESDWQPCPSCAAARSEGSDG